MAAAELGCLWQATASRNWVSACGQARVSGHLAPTSREGWAEGKGWAESGGVSQELSKERGPRETVFPDICVIKMAAGQGETGSPLTKWAWFGTAENLESQQFIFPALGESMRKCHSNKLEKNSYL